MWSVSRRRRLASTERKDVIARQPGVVGTVAHRHPRLGGQEHIVATSGDRLPENLLRHPGRIHVCRVEQVDACVEAERDLLLRAVDIGRADRARPALAPNVIVPRLNAETRSPELPSCR